jgi:hypothetical protein
MVGTIIKIAEAKTVSAICCFVQRSRHKPDLAIAIVKIFIGHNQYMSSKKRMMDLWPFKSELVGVSATGRQTL